MTGRVPGARVAALTQGLSLMPMTDEVFDAVTDSGSAKPLGFRLLPGGFEKTLAEWSAAGPVAHVEAEYFGGAGRQRAALWADRALAAGPSDEPAKPRFFRTLSPISHVLRRPGEDEFAAVGLDRHRNNDGWISASS
ncbi:hypothetical protein [Streptomyces sp. NPDC101455]|uniref:hypothetical protein n=1 Tax=Streptomyces sp. NPDC101455 TaxID=3366142 RepID=UPI00382C19DF